MCAHSSVQVHEGTKEPLVGGAHPTLWVLGLKLKASHLAASTFICEHLSGPVFSFYALSVQMINNLIAMFSKAFF